MNDNCAAVARSEADFHTRAERLGASKEHAERVLRQAILDTGSGEEGNPYELAYLQLAADLHQNPE